MNSDSKPSSIPEIKQGFTVPASPLNQIKLELGAILIMGLALLLIVGFIADTRVSQMGILMSFGLTAMAWIVFRVRKTLKKLDRSDMAGTVAVAESQVHEDSIAPEASRTPPLTGKTVE